jgi:hypothetical protein
MRISGALVALALSGFANAAFATEPIDKGYVKSLAAPDKKVLVVEYLDGADKVVDRKGYASESGWNAKSATEFEATKGVVLKLFGVAPCSGELVVKSENFAGTCDDHAKANLQTMLSSAHVIFCRSFVTEQAAASQDTTCYGYYAVPGAMDSVDMIEEQLVSLGALRPTKKADGTGARPDLADAEEIAMKGSYGMWSDPRTRSQ